MSNKKDEKTTKVRGHALLDGDTGELLAAGVVDQDGDGIAIIREHLMRDEPASPRTHAPNWNSKSPKASRWQPSGDAWKKGSDTVH